jgi:hypothetical protein
MDLRQLPTSSRTLLVVALVLLAALSRLLPHPPNFTPIEAIALFAGATLGSRWLAVLVPIAALFVSDLVLGLHAGMPAVYACVALLALAGGRLGPAPRARWIALAGLGGAVLFYLVTNFVTWLGIGHPPMYPMTAEGLLACYVAALPFFGPTLASQLLFAAVLFGGQRGCERLLRAAKARPRVAP